MPDHVHDAVKYSAFLSGRSVNQEIVTIIAASYAWDDDVSPGHKENRRMLKLYEFAVVLQPKLDKDGEVTDPGRIVVDPKTVLAEDEQKATLLAGRWIPEDLIGELERLTLVVRPF